MAEFDTLKGRLRAEMIQLAVTLGLGLLVVPVAIFLIGQGTLGPYRDEAGLGTFLADYFVQLVRGHVGTWLLALGPLLLLLLLRSIGWVWRFRSMAEDPDEP